MSVRFIPLSVKLEAAVSKDTRAGSSLCALVLFPTTCTSHVLFEPLDEKESCEESSRASGIPSTRVAQSRDSRTDERVMHKLDFMNSNGILRHDVKISRKCYLYCMLCAKKSGMQCCAPAWRSWQDRQERCPE